MGFDVTRVEDDKFWLWSCLTSHTGDSTQESLKTREHLDYVLY